MKKLCLAFLTILFVGISMWIASAATVNLDPEGILANNSYQTVAHVIHGFNVTGGNATYTCYLYTNENGSNGVGAWRTVETESAVANNTNINFTNRTAIKEQGSTYAWDVFCNGTGTSADSGWGAGGNASAINRSSVMWNYTIDITNPYITVNEPTDLSWNNDGYVIFNITVRDNNSDSCILRANLNVSDNTTGVFNRSIEILSYTNATALNFSFGNATLSKWADNNNATGLGILYEFFCNDSAGRTTSSGNLSFYIDDTDPSTFDLNTSAFKTDNRNWWNDTTATDYTPQIGWTATTEKNFSRYLIQFCNASWESCVELNSTSRTLLNLSMSTLVGDTTYYINMTAYDLAGNKRSVGNTTYKYSTDSTNRALAAGWNIIGNPGNAFTLSHIRNWTSASTVSLWNSTHEWTSHVSGGSYGTNSVAISSPVLVYVSAATTLSDLVWNKTAVDVDRTVNLTNQSNSDWNLVMNRNYSADYTFNQLDIKLNNCTGPGTCVYGNVTYLSKYDNTASAGSKYVSLVSNWSINNDTSMHFGNCMWAYFDGDANSNFNVTLDWSNMTQPGG